MHQPDAPLGDDRRRRGHCRWRVTWQGLFQDRHHLAATVRQDRRRRRRPCVSRGKDPSSGMHQVAALEGDGQRRCGCCLGRKALQGPRREDVPPGVGDDRMRLSRAVVRRRGMGPFREIHQLGSTVGDDLRWHGRADGGRRDKSPPKRFTNWVSRWETNGGGLGVPM